MNRLAVLACTTLLTACVTEVTPDDEDEGSLPFTTKPDVIGNGIRGPDVIGNGLMFIPGALNALISNPLATETFDPSTGPAELVGICDEATRKYMRYLVETALEWGQEVKYCGERYFGMMGMHPSWNKDKPTVEGLEATTAGLVARINPLGLPVMLSPRGLRPEKDELGTSGPVPADIFDSTAARNPIASFHKHCTPLQVGATRNCGWNKDDAFVGTCTPFKQVQAGAGAVPGCVGPPLGSAVLDTVMRICTSTFGCNHGGTGWIKSVDNTCGLNPAATFTCPASGVFTIMFSGVTEGLLYSGAVGTKSAFPVAFPDKVFNLFGLLEGSFWGNIYDESKLNPNIKVESQGGDKGVKIFVDKATEEHTGIGSKQVYFFEDCWACNDPAFTSGIAAQHARLCTDLFVEGPSGPELVEGCVCQPLGDCNVVAADDASNLCPIYDTAPMLGDTDHDDCLDGFGNNRRWPVTTFLHDECDLLPREDWQLCERK